MGPAGYASSRSESALNVASDTGYATLVSTPNAPDATVAATLKSAAPQPASTVTVRPSNVAQSGLLVLNEVRASKLKTRVLVALLTGSMKSTSAEKVADDGTSIPRSVDRSPCGARVKPDSLAQACCAAVPLTRTPLTRTAFGSGSCRKTSTSASASGIPHGAHCATSSMPHSRTAPGLTLTDHAASLPAGAARSKLDVRELRLSCAAGTSIVVLSESVATAST